jgi:site-specific recombinase XerD
MSGHSGHVSDRWHLKRTARPGESTCEHRKVPTSKHGKGRRWQVEYSDPAGKLHYPCFDTEQQAGDYLVKVRADMLRGTYRDDTAGQITLEKYISTVWLPSRSFDPSTRERVQTALRCHILPGLGGKQLRELDALPSLTQAFASSLKLAPSSAAHTMVVLTSIMRCAMRDKLIHDNPCVGVDLPKIVKRRIEPWTPQTSALVRAGLPERYRAMIDAGTGLGLRQGELFAMSVENTGFLTRVVHVRVQVKVIGNRAHFSAPKGQKERTVPLAAQTGERLSAHLAEFPAVPITLPWHEPGTRRHGKPRTLNLLFTMDRGSAVDRTVFNRYVWRPARATAGLEDDRINGMHMMRHVYASTLIARGIDVRTVAEYLGHSDGGALVLKTYSHLLPDAEDRARRALEEALSTRLPVASDTGSM